MSIQLLVRLVRLGHLTLDDTPTAAICTVNPPENAVIESPSVLHRTPAAHPTQPLRRANTPRRPPPPRRSPDAPGVVVRSASTANENGPWTPVGSERGRKRRPDSELPLHPHRPLRRLELRLPKVPAVSPNRMSHADTMAPASKSTGRAGCRMPRLPPVTSLAVVPITSPGTMVCTTVTPTFEVVSGRIGTSPDPPFCRSGEAETVGKPVT